MHITSKNFSTQTLPFPPSPHTPIVKIFSFLIQIHIEVGIIEIRSDYIHWRGTSDFERQRRQIGEKEDTSKNANKIQLKLSI